MFSPKSTGTRIDFVPDLPYEIFDIIFSDFPIKTLLNCKRVSKLWKQIFENDRIWRSKFQQKSWKYYNDDSETDSWYELYKERHLLELNWKNGTFTQHRLSGHSHRTCCVKFFKNWILTGSSDCTIRIWDKETFQCLRILGKLNLKTKGRGPPGSEKLESTKEFHFLAITCMEINDKYLVSGSDDCSCIIWLLPELKPIDRLLIPIEGSSSSGIRDVALYNDYIVSCDYYHAWVWKSSPDNLEHPLRFNLQHHLKADTFINGIYVYNGIIYVRDFGAIIFWNIETGQIIRLFRYDQVKSMAVGDQYLFVGRKQITVRDLQSNKLVNDLPEQYNGQYTSPVQLSVYDNKFISVFEDCSIKIWNLNDLKLFKEFKKLEYGELYLRPDFSIGIDSKRLAAFSLYGDAVIYDFTENLRKKYLKHL